MSSRTLTTAQLLVLLAAAPAFVLAQSPTPTTPAAVRADPLPRDGILAILRAFASHDVVLLGEIHWSVAQHRFIQRLIRDRRLPDAASVIAVEFANARYQPLIDRYIGGSDVPLDSLRRVWLDAIVPLAWDASVYPEFFRSVRLVNRSLPANRRLRVLALDPPIPWDSVHSSTTSRAHGVTAIQSGLASSNRKYSRRDERRS